MNSSANGSPLYRIPLRILQATARIKFSLDSRTAKGGDLRSREPIQHIGSFCLRPRPQPCTILCLDLVSEKANIRLVVRSIGELFADNQVDCFHQPDAMIYRCSALPYSFEICCIRGQPFVERSTLSEIASASASERGFSIRLAIAHDRRGRNDLCPRNRSNVRRSEKRLFCSCTFGRYAFIQLFHTSPHYCFGSFPVDFLW